MVGSPSGNLSGSGTPPPSQLPPRFESEVELSEVSNLDDLEQEYDQYKAAEDRERVVGRGDDEYDDDLRKGKVDYKETELEYWNSTNGTTNLLAPKATVPSYEEGQVGPFDIFYHDLKDRMTLGAVKHYFESAFPIIKWLPFYNWKWGYADLVAGITVGCVLVPQSMSYAQIATLPPQYGLYSSFVGAFIYSFFATSKDVCIGPVAVMSLETAKVIQETLEKFPKEDHEVTGPLIATALALLCGIVAMGAGVLRLGFLVELISLNAVAGFMTGSSLNIISGQVPALMGFKKYVHTRDSTYKIIINSLKNLKHTQLDAVFGLIPLVLLYTWKWWCSSYGPKLADRHFKNNPKKRDILKTFYFYAQAMRSAVIIIVFTAISYGITKGRKTPRISVLGKVPKGLKDVHVMRIPEGLLSKMGSSIPSAIIILLLEHISIAKSFGRVNNYKVVPDQELIAIGATNLIGTFFNAYPATGSFSRSALKAKCNVRTPLSGVFSGACVLLALYCLTQTFYYIPSATLSAVIIHAVSDLCASYKTSWNFYKMNPGDFIAFIVTVFITVFSSIDYGIYFAMCWSAAMFLLKNMFAPGRFLGRVEVAEVVNAQVDPNVESVSESAGSHLDGFQAQSSIESSSKKLDPLDKSAVHSNYLNGGDDGSDNNINNQIGQKLVYHTKWISYDRSYSREFNPEVPIQPPPPGVIVYRFGDSYTYLNCSRHYDIIYDEVRRTTRRGQMISAVKKVDRPWNDPGEWEAPRWFKKLTSKKKTAEEWAETEAQESKAAEQKLQDNRPLLKIICLDFSQCSQTDATAIQNLTDLRKQVNRYADRQVEFHICGLYAPWVKRALVNFGFGTVNEEYSDESLLAGHRSYHVARAPTSLEDGLGSPAQYSVYPASGTNLPFFHVEIPDFSKWDL
ncbi:hypothetical protein ZYGR_0I00580 [Zygosaccharomyces rouxii]|uniref:ZYRO0C01452p n=2 Tax=Zygosaccharomyces rouxii TaxID=4956 RepID=C5DSM5_ZYGRC|nr:uncharacterized protein ZYRO0C01452g [Zygosaccharomyces rouxii]KAH9202023.1 sulfate transporter family-domain-containing protein [Zygosaccharomyces rouxii]GAV47762.1 hypothetical protein ZYGR_0I00580 [Zygosaccharomyces rouxii]CAR26786.1 ZYRO0C01452p [Zygosaccharomyces rouxii]